MEGGFFDELRQLEFFPAGSQNEKRTSSCMPVVSTQSQITSGDHLHQGIYQDEESVDFSALLEAYNTATVPNGNTGVPAVTTAAATRSPSARQEPVTTNSAYHQTYTEYLSHDIGSLAHPSMYNSGDYGTSIHGQVEMTPSPSSLVDCIPPSPHVVQIDNSVPSYTPLRPAPGKSPRSGKTKKQSVDKNSEEYRDKRDRNNIAVRKSREKSKVRVMDTEKRVRELEDENSQLQSKIALLSKELNVLKSLFTSAGVSQPSFKGERS